MSLALHEFNTHGLPPIGPEGIISVMTHSSGRWNPAPTFAATSNWPTANKAFYAKIIIKYPCIVTSFFWVNGTAASGNVDTGLYDALTNIKIASTGTVARSGTSALQISTLTNPIYVNSGPYYLAHVSDTTTNSRTVIYTKTIVGEIEFMGGMSQTSAFNLPATATPAAQVTNFLLPMVGMFTNLCGLTL